MRKTGLSRARWLSLQSRLKATNLPDRLCFKTTERRPFCEHFLNKMLFNEEVCLLTSVGDRGIIQRNRLSEACVCLKEKRRACCREGGRKERAQF